MSLTLMKLQEEQFKHDQACHRDILYLSYQERFKHIAMHYGKYSGRLASILRKASLTPDDFKLVRKTLVDSFIIVLNSSELLQLDLDTSLRTKLGIDTVLPISQLSDLLIESSPDISRSLGTTDHRERILNLLLEVTAIGGYMQKVGEELDHMVGLEKEKLVTQTINMLVILLVAGKLWDVDYSSSVPQRWDEIAKKTVIKGPQ